MYVDGGRPQPDEDWLGSTKMMGLVVAWLLLVIVAVGAVLLAF